MRLAFNLPAVIARPTVAMASTFDLTVITLSSNLLLAFLALSHIEVLGASISTLDLFRRRFICPSSWRLHSSPDGPTNSKDVFSLMLQKPAI